ncbi:MAG: HAD-IIB family hydrolase [bacterium]|nr:HAD-IIB family hydrolase [bacterium]
MKPNPKIIIFDLDGTLTESKQRISAEMGDLLERLLQKMPVAVMSGAGFPQFEKQFFSALGDETHFERLYLFPDNAAQCFVFVQGAWHPRYDYHFSDTEKTRIRQALGEALAVVGLTPEPPRPPEWGERIEDRGAEIVFSGLGQAAPLEEKQKWDPTGEKKKALRDELARRLPEFSEATGGSTSVDITRKDITKSYGIKRLQELTGIPIAEMLYVGDALEEGGNDAVVIDTGVPTHAVFSPGETAALIKTLLRNHS